MIVRHRLLTIKDNAVKALRILQNENFRGVLAIVDADFDNLSKRTVLFYKCFSNYLSKNGDFRIIKRNIIYKIIQSFYLERNDYQNQSLFLTDFHDLECIIVVSPAFEKILSEFGSANKIKEFERGKSIREIIIEIGSFIGYLRWVSRADELNLKFEDLDFGRFISKDDLGFNLDSFINTVKNKSQRLDLDNAQIAQTINNLASKDYDKKQVSCGKDIIEIISLGLQKVLGTKSRENPIDSERIGQGLRLAYEFEFFVSTNLYQNVKSWEEQNLPFRVFR